MGRKIKTSHVQIHILERGATTVNGSAHESKNSSPKAQKQNAAREISARAIFVDFGNAFALFGRAITAQPGSRSSAAVTLIQPTKSRQ
jgi:hypothetical protein